MGKDWHNVIIVVIVVVIVVGGLNASSSSLFVMRHAFSHRHASSRYSLVSLGQRSWRYQ
jgi:hypothetical protein